MAENVRWLLERRHPGEKLILWVANSHAAKDVSCIGTSGTSYDGALRGWNTMGSRLAASLGERYVAIATTAYGGRIGNAPVAPRDLDVAPPGSLEERCVRAGAAYSIAWPAAEPRVGRFFGYEPFRAPWSKVFDLALVIRNMAPVDAE
jgi:erythromycin esterase-like protein